MSRIGKKAVDIPAGVNVTVSDDNLVTVKGAKGELSQQINPALTVKVEDNQVKVTRPDDTKANRSAHGLYRSLIANMVTGVSTGFEKAVLIVGTGYRAQAQGKKLTINVGYSHPVEVIAPDNIEFVVENFNGTVEYAERSKVGNPTKITVKGMNKQLVGQVAADIRAIRPPEPYLGKGIRYFDEVIRRKEGKAAG